jgi:DNA polymerase III epsilon subunit-like protein
MSETGSPVQIDRTDTGHTGNNGQDGFGLSENGDVITTTTTTSSGQNQYRHKMRPPSQAAFQRVKNCYPKMSKKEKRFDPSKAIIPRLMPDEPMTIAINPNLPHQPLDYFQDGELLIEAVQSGKIDQVEFLLSIKSLDVNYRRVATGQTALMYCKCPHIAKLLLKQGADPNLQNRMGNTALHFAVAQSNYQLVQVLITRGASKRIKNHYSQGITPCQVPSSNSSLIGTLQSHKTHQPSRIHWPISFQRRATLSETLSIDFEMIGIVNPEWGHHVMIDFPVEVGIVDSKLNTVYYSRCRPDHLPQTGQISYKMFKKIYSPPVDHLLHRPSIDLRTRITGIRPGELDQMPLASQVLAEVRQIIQGKYLVGHAIEHDLLVLEHFGPPFQGIRDTSQYLRWKGKKISLKKAAQHYLQKTIQSGKHGALEDARTTMELYLLFRDEWESSDEPFLLPPNQIRQIIDESSKTDQSKSDDKEKNHNRENHNRVGENSGGVENSLQPSSSTVSNDIGLEDLEKFPDLKLN